LVSGAIQRYTIPQGHHDEQAERQVMALAASGNTLWVASLTGLHRFDSLTGQYDAVIELDPRQLRERSAQQLLFDRDGVLWYASAAGLYRVDKDGEHALIGPPAVTSSLLVDNDGKLWVGRADGLFHLQPDRLQGDRTLRKVWPGSDDTHGEPTDVRSIVQADDGALWLSVYGDGLRRLDPTTGEVRRIAAQAMDSGVPENTISKLMIDDGGLLWAGG